MGPQLIEASTRMAVKLVATIAEYSVASPASFAAHVGPMAQLLLQVARIDQPGLKAEVAALSPAGQQTVQRLLREHMTSANQAAQGPVGGAGPALAPAKAKIELKMKF